MMGRGGSTEGPGELDWRGGVRFAVPWKVREVMFSAGSLYVAERLRGLGSSTSFSFDFFFGTFFLDGCPDEASSDGSWYLPSPVRGTNAVFVFAHCGRRETAEADEEVK